jgi:predicted DsbA family dithiol-disulfide isomerase
MNALDISDHAVQQTILKQVGIDTPVAEILANEEYKAQVMLDERIAHENNMTGVPALVFAEKYLVMGAQPLDVLTRVAEQVEQEAKEEDTSNS